MVWGFKVLQILSFINCDDWDVLVSGCYFMSINNEEAGHTSQDKTENICYYTEGTFGGKYLFLLIFHMQGVPRVYPYCFWSTLSKLR